jgi:hypothetical protein
MNKRTIIIGLLVFTPIITLFAGCNSGESPTTSTSLPDKTIVNNSTSAPSSAITTVTNSSNSEAFDHVNNIDDISPVYFEWNIYNQKTPEDKKTDKIWVKGMKVKIVGESKIVSDAEEYTTIYDRTSGIIIGYEPNSSVATKQFDPGISKALGAVWGIGRNIAPIDPQMLSKFSTQDLQQKGIFMTEETWDGKICQVITQKNTDAGEYKYWFWKDKSILIKREKPSTDGTKAVTEFRNFDFNYIPDSIFEVPAGYTIKDEGVSSGSGG